MFATVTTLHGCLFLFLLKMCQTDFLICASECERFSRSLTGHKMANLSSFPPPNRHFIHSHSPYSHIFSPPLHPRPSVHLSSPDTFVFLSHRPSCSWRVVAKQIKHQTNDQIVHFMAGDICSAKSLVEMSVSFYDQTFPR